MLLDLIKKPHKAEPKRIFTFRRIVIISLIALLLCFAVLLFLRMLDEQTTFTRTLLPASNSTPMPDMYFYWDQPFVINCSDQTFTNETCGSSILQTTRQNNPNDTRPYYGGFMSNIQLSENGFLDLLIYTTDKTNASASNYYMLMYIYDQEYDPYRPGFITGKDALFDSSLDSLNQYYLSGKTFSFLTYSRTLQQTIKNSALNYLGFLSSYNTQKVVGTALQVVDYNYTDFTGVYIRIEISPSSFSITEQKEQRTNTVMTLAGTICAYYGFVIAVYTCLFGVGILNPLGVVHNGCCGMNKRKCKYNNSAQIETSDMMEYGDLEKRIKGLEEFKVLLQENVLDLSLLETSGRRTEKTSDD